MRILWTLVKVVVGLAIAIPLGIIVLATTLGLVGALIGLAVMALKLACVGVAAYVVFRVARGVFFSGSSRRKAPPPLPRELAPRDPYYDAALRELDSELGHGAR
ncbi:MAG TPA: hypothetical protein VN706_13015 [Gemmatimonadaceae bacterium]|nr:hypothetical protein [Gemmatimonadaceae bacterium]